MTSRRLNMMAALMTLPVIAGFAGCRYHELGFAVHRLRDACGACSNHDHTYHYVDRTPDSHYFSVTPNAAPLSQYSKGVVTSSPSPNRRPSEPPLLVPLPSVLVPVEEPSFQLLPPNPLELPVETRSSFFPGKKTTLDLIPLPEPKLPPYSARRSSPVFAPVESQKRLVPHATNPNGLVRKIKAGFNRLFSGKRSRNFSSTSAGSSSRRTRSLSRNKSPKRQVSQQRVGKMRETSRVADSRTPKVNHRTNSSNTLVRAQQKNPVTLQFLQPIP